MTEREGEIVEVVNAANIMDEAVKGLPVVVAEGGLEGKEAVVTKFVTGIWWMKQRVYRTV